MTHTKQITQKQPGSGIQQATRGQGITNPGASMSGGAPPASSSNTSPGAITSNSSPPASSGATSSTSGISGGRPVVGGIVPHHNLIRGRRYVPYEQTMAAKLARENWRWNWALPMRVNLVIIFATQSIRLTSILVKQNR